MPILLLTPRCLALLGLLLVSLVVLADGVARIELTQAVHSPLVEGARVVAHIVAADD